MCEVLDQPTINRFTEIDLLNHELASIYIAGAQQIVTLSDGRTTNWTGSTAREKKRKRSEAA